MRFIRDIEGSLQESPHQKGDIVAVTPIRGFSGLARVVMLASKHGKHSFYKIGIDVEWTNRRPPLPDPLRRHVTQVCTVEEEYKQVKAAAKMCGVSVSKWARKVIVKAAMEQLSQNHEEGIFDGSIVERRDLEGSERPGGECQVAHVDIGAC